jgi:hypothetical protein
MILLGLNAERSVLSVRRALTALSAQRILKKFFVWMPLISARPYHMTVSS